MQEKSWQRDCTSNSNSHLPDRPRKIKSQHKAHCELLKRGRKLLSKTCISFDWTDIQDLWIGRGGAQQKVRLGREAGTRSQKALWTVLKSLVCVG